MVKYPLFERFYSSIIPVLVQKTLINPISIVQKQGIIEAKYFITLGKTARSSLSWIRLGGGGVLPYMGYIGMCRCKEYGFKAVHSGIGRINQRL